MTIKKQYFKLSKEEFEKYIDELRNDNHAYHFFGNEFFFVPTKQTNELILSLHKKQLEIDSFINNLDEYKKQTIINFFIIDEIKTTNSIENIYSTRHDIFSIMKDVKSVNDKHIKSLLQAYELLSFDIKDEYSIREIYDLMMKNSYNNKADIPDGKLFRKEDVEITGGIKIYHKGFYPEDKIISSIKEFLSFYLNKEIDIYERLIISHFLFETIHPFYDGNGRLGRLLFSIELYKETNSILSYTIATSIDKNKKDYYKSFEKARDRYQYGYLNDYFIDISNILIQGFNETLNDLSNKYSLYKNNQQTFNNKSMNMIYDLLLWNTYFTYYGISNIDILAKTSLSKRTVINVMNALRENNQLIDFKIGKETYHKLVI